MRSRMQFGCNETQADAAQSMRQGNVQYAALGGYHRFTVFFVQNTGKIFFHCDSVGNVHADRTNLNATVIFHAQMECRVSNCRSKFASSFQWRRAYNQSLPTLQAITHAML